ncbi:hypothetical protein M3Y99_00359100 [Aphelenchoides fujianensis]|nr:hypothetical protein M3Y99_00359100 [Aphelenchoides fujianensis]
MLLKDGRLFFGQTAENRTEGGGFCASFNKDGDLFATCDHFRVFSNFPTKRRVNRRVAEVKFYLLRPEFFDPLLDDPVAFGERQLVIVYDVQSDSSFFGTFEQGVVFAVDYEGAPVEISGQSATSGDFLMLVARSRPLFNPYGRICRPVGSELEESE